MDIRKLLCTDKIVQTDSGRYPKSQVKAMQKAVKAAEKERKKKK